MLGNDMRLMLRLHRRSLIDTSTKNHTKPAAIDSYQSHVCLWCFISGNPCKTKSSSGRCDNSFSPEQTRFVKVTLDGKGEIIHTFILFVFKEILCLGFKSSFSLHWCFSRRMLRLTPANGWLAPAAAAAAAAGLTEAATRTHCAPTLPERKTDYWSINRWSHPDHDDDALQLILYHLYCFYCRYSSGILRS